MISRNRFFDITNSMFWYHKIDFLTSQNKPDFVISKILFCDIENSNLWYHKIEFVIAQNLRDFVISKNLFCDITNSIFRYHKITLTFFISQIQFCDITKSRRFCDMTKYEVFSTDEMMTAIKKKKSYALNLSIGGRHCLCSFKVCMRFKYLRELSFFQRTEM